MKPSPSRILLVEDDPNDAYFLLESMTEAGLQPPIHVAVDGQHAIDYLSGEGQFADRNAHPVPECIFLDLKLPLIHGFEVLQWLRGQNALKEIPVFILTSSSEERDRERARQLDARAYLVKPATPELLISTLNLLRDPSVIEPSAEESTQ